MHYAVPRILHRAGFLHSLYTDIHARSMGIQWLRRVPDAFLPHAVQRLLDRTPGVPEKKIRSFPLMGIRYALKVTRAMTATEQTEAYLWGGTAFTERILADDPSGPTGVYTFNSAGLELLRAAQARGWTAIMEQTIAPAEVEARLLREEYEAHPTWAASPEDNHRLEQYADRERREWRHADVILCGSKFVKQGIEECGGPGERCVVVPYGVEMGNMAVEEDSPVRSQPHTPIRVLTVGTVGLRKGSPYVLEAARRLGSEARVRLVGSVDVQPPAQQNLAEATELTGRVPRSTVRDHYQWADLFLLPSICEGSATVCYEALANGLPVICTPNTGAIVRDGVEGFVVPIRSAEAIVEAVRHFVNTPETYRTMSERAQRRAKEKGSLDAYAKRLTATVQEWAEGPS